MTSALLAVADSPLAVGAGWTVLLIVWGTSLVALMLAGWRSLRPVVHADRQHRAAVFAWVACTVILVVTPVLSRNLSRLPQTTVVSSPPSVSSSTPIVVATASSNTTVELSPPLDLNRVAGVGGLVWLAGAAVLLVRLAGGWIVTQRVRLRASVVKEVSAQKALDRVLQHFGVTNSVSLRRSAEVEAPVVLGARQPAILLPDDLADQMPEDALAPLLAHECAHISRHDYAVNLAQSALDALLFFSPGAYWVSQRLREAREFCCDDAAVQFCAEDRGQYVRVLATLASLGCETRGLAALGSAGPRLITRVRRLLSEDTMSRPSVSRTLAVSLAFVLLGAFAPPMLRLSARHLAALPVAASGAAVQSEWPLPIGYAPSQPASSVTLQVARGPDYLAETITIRNSANVAVTSVTLVGVIENQSLRVSRIVTSSPIPVTVAPGATVSITTRFVSRETLADVAAGGEPVKQVFFGLSRVTFGNGAEWSMSPNPAARNHHEALGLPTYSIPRSLIAAEPGGDPAKAVCLDDSGNETSQGGVMAIRDEPGRFAECINGSWVDYMPGQEAAARSSDSFSLDLALKQDGAPAALRGYTANAGRFYYESATVENLSQKSIDSVAFGVLIVDQVNPAVSRSLSRTAVVPVDIHPGQKRTVTVDLLTPAELDNLMRSFKGRAKITIGLLEVGSVDGNKWICELPADAVDFSSGKGRSQQKSEGDEWHLLTSRVVAILETWVNEASRPPY